MKLAAAFVAPILLATLAACGEVEPENIQAKAEDTADMLENEANQITADAENGVQSAVDTLENQAAALEEQFEGNEAAGNDAAAGNQGSNQQ